MVAPTQQGWVAMYEGLRQRKPQPLKRHVNRDLKLWALMQALHAWTREQVEPHLELGGPTDWAQEGKKWGSSFSYASFTSLGERLFWLIRWVLVLPRRVGQYPRICHVKVPM